MTTDSASIGLGFHLAKQCVVGQLPTNRVSVIASAFQHYHLREVASLCPSQIMQIGLLFARNEPSSYTGRTASIYLDGLGLPGRPWTIWTGYRSIWTDRVYLDVALVHLNGFCLSGQKSMVGKVLWIADPARAINTTPCKGLEG
jgi:hypothetical protein